MNLSLKFVALAGVFVVAFGVSVTSGQALLQDPLGQRIERFSVRQTFLVDALSRISAKYKIPIGLEKVVEFDEDKFSLGLKNVTIRDVLDAIVKKDGRHTWSFEDEVIRVRPLNPDEKCESNISDVEIQDFQFNGRISYLNLRANLTNIPEVRAALSRCEMVASHIDNVRIEIGNLPSFSIDAKNVRFDAVLNEIVRQGPRKMWIITSPSTNVKELTLNFL